VSKLEGVHPELVEKVKRILFALAELGYPMVVTDGARTLAQQQSLYAQGRTKPGLRVTDADGVTSLSNHQVRSDGYGRAVDCAFLINGKPAWPETGPWRLYGEAAKALGLRWGGDWKRPDRPHIELPAVKP
jgi:peptidoglycan L-alanyl-D-glutamate endopeptidase CwlK